MTGFTAHDGAAAVADVASRFDDLRPQEQKAALELLLEQGPRFGVFPLTVSQQRLWFSSKMEENLPLYNVPFAFRLTGELDVPALRYAIGELVRRHEMLRAVIFDVAGEPFQAILPTMSVPLEVLAWHPGDETWLAALLDAEAAAPFDLRHGPLIRARLATDGGREHVFMLSLHHVVCDGWSMMVIFRELGEFYSAFVEGRPPRLAPLTGRFFEVAARQEARERAIQAELLGYWRTQLGGAPSLLALPTDYPRPPLAAHRGRQVVLDWPIELRHAVERFAAARQTTVFVTVLAAFAAVLRRYTGQEDILIGVPSAGRSSLDAENLVGLFINTLALRLRPAAQMSFADLLAQAREVTMTAQAYQDLPFDVLVESLQLQRTASYHPLVQVFFIVQEAETEALLLPGLSCEVVLGHTGTSKFDLTLSLVAVPGGFRGTAEYDTALFGEQSVIRVIGDLRAMLAAALADPDKPIGSLPLADRDRG